MWFFNHPLPYEGKPQIHTNQTNRVPIHGFFSRLSPDAAARRCFAYGKTCFAAEGCICVICGFSNLFGVNLIKHNLGAKPSKDNRENCHRRPKLNQSLLFISHRKTNTIFREERADEKAPALSIRFFVCPPFRKTKGEKKNGIQL